MPDVIDIATIGEDVPLLEGIRTSCAVRRLLPEPVPAALIRKVCEAGTFAPSGGNRQPWSFIAVTEPARRAWVAERYRKVFDAYIAPGIEASRKGAFDETKRKILGGAVHLAAHLHEAPVLLFVAGWKRRGQEQEQALFPAIENILLACRAVGLGASLTTLTRSFRDELDPWLGLPPEQPSCAMLPIGWPKVPHRKPIRRSIDDCLHFETFDVARDGSRRDRPAAQETS
ncbi:MAG: nitroreductase family protein [Deltaproteobacteria bacterium]